MAVSSVPYLKMPSLKKVLKVNPATKCSLYRKNEELVCKLVRGTPCRAAVEG